MQYPVSCRFFYSGEHSSRGRSRVANFDVTIAGELNLDLILYGLPEQLTPERELLASEMALTLGSSSAIVAHNLASLGNRVGFISCIGGDQFGQAALERLRQAGVDISKLLKKPEPAKTGLTIILQREGWRNLLTYPGTILDLQLEDLDFDYLSSSRHFHLSSFYLQRNLRPRVPELLKRLKAAGLTTSLDCNDDPADRWDKDLIEALRYVDVFLPNAREAMRITAQSSIEEAVERLARVVTVLVVKLGAKGALARRGTEEHFSPGLKIDVVDPVGAGDSFDAGFLHQFIRGADLAACLRAGNVAGALSTTCPGGTEAFRDRDRRDRFYREHEGDEQA
jgi:sugar/nucleoside kinase (ribokinase family)